MNQEFLKTLLNRIPWGVALGCYLAWQGVQFYQFNNSMDSPKLMKQAEIQQAQIQVEQMRKKLKEAQEFQKSLDVKRAELRAMATELAGMRAGLSEDFNVPDLIRTVTREATRVGLRVSSFQPATEGKHEYYTEKVFKLSFTGVYVQLLVFLDRIANLQKILRVDGFDFRPKGPQDRKYVEIGGTLSILAYKYTGSKADTIGAPTAPPNADGAAKNPNQGSDAASAGGGQ